MTQLYDKRIDIGAVFEGNLWVFLLATSRRCPFEDVFLLPGLFLLLTPARYLNKSRCPSESERKKRAKRGEQNPKRGCASFNGEIESCFADALCGGENPITSDSARVDSSGQSSSSPSKARHAIKHLHRVSRKGSRLLCADRGRGASLTSPNWFWPRRTIDFKGRARLNYRAINHRGEVRFLSQHRNLSFRPKPAPSSVQLITERRAGQNNKKPRVSPIV